MKRFATPVCRVPLERDENGKVLCRYCRGAIPKGRRTTCSAKCADEILVRTGHGHAIERLLFARDKGFCAICGMNTEAKREAFMELYRLYDRWADPRPEIQHLISERLNYLFRRIKPNPGGNSCFDTVARRRRWWDADHIVPVVEGGGECGIENYRTLCIGCHQSETAKLRKRLSEKKREGRE